MAKRRSITGIKKAKPTTRPTRAKQLQKKPAMDQETSMQRSPDTQSMDTPQRLLHLLPIPPSQRKTPIAKSSAYG
ncbi:MAG: hypothetical protein Q9164_001193 [Protoblastenia rupestris]